MTQQEAYQRLVGHLQDMQMSYNQAQQLAKDYNLEMKCLSYFDPVPECIDPDLLEEGRYGKKFKDDANDYRAGRYLSDSWITSTEAGC